jgi:hypothetical protein
LQSVAPASVGAEVPAALVTVMSTRWGNATAGDTALISVALTGVVETAGVSPNATP